MRNLQYEDRPCRSCGGLREVLVEASYDSTTGELVQVLSPSPICHGRGTLSVFVYQQPDLRRLADGEVMFLCWNGTAREKVMAEKEMRRRLREADNALLDD